MKPFWIFLCACAATTPPAQLVQQRNTTSDATFARTLATIGTPEVATTRSVVVRFDQSRMLVGRAPQLPLSTTVVPGMRDGEAFVETPEGLLFVGAHCVLPADCGARCAEIARYQLRRTPEGKQVLVRERTVYAPVRVKVKTCTYGCGTAQPYDEGRDVPAILVGSMPSEVRDVPHATSFIEPYCDDPIGVP